MKIASLITAAAFAFLLFAVPPPGRSGADIEGMIVHAHSVIMDRSSSSDAIRSALLELLDAALLILPKTEPTAESRSRIDGARREFEQKSMFSDKGYQYLALAYRLVANGKKWQMPEELSGTYRAQDMMTQAQTVGKRLIASALGELKAGHSQESVRYLLEYVLMVITPVEA